MKKYNDTLSYLFSLQNFGIKLGLTNILALLKKLSMPHEKYKTIHIAGTNGKGSTAAALESLLMKAGYRVGLYTSPHLIDFRERMRVNREEIDEASVIRITELVREKKEELAIDCEITFFEYTTAMAFYYFMEQNVDIAIIEVGMGGRLDATNIITPMVSVITSISMEHQQYLGNTIFEIAGEKAGIIKEKIPVISGVNDVSAKSVISKIARKKNAYLYQLYDDFNYKATGNSSFDYTGIKHKYAGLTKSLIGDHQFDNFSLALAALEIISSAGFDVDEKSVRDGLADVKWPGRFEVFSKDPLIILDGAHNEHSIETAVKALKKNYPDRKVISIIGIMKDKNIKSIVNSIEEISHTIILTKPSINRAAEPSMLAGYFTNDGKIMRIPSVKSAIERAKDICGDDSLIFISGSLFTVGDARKHLLGLPEANKKDRDLR